MPAALIFRLSLISLGCFAAVCTFACKRAAEADAPQLQLADLLTEFETLHVDSTKQSLRPAGAQQAKKQLDYALFYFGASWCGPCRQFSPQLKAWYQHHWKQEAPWQLYYVSLDRSDTAMEHYLLRSDAPWPIISNSAAMSSPSLRSLMPMAIPAMVLLDAQGRVLYPRSEQESMLGANAALQHFEQLLQGSAQKSSLEPAKQPSEQPKPDNGER